MQRKIVLIVSLVAGLIAALLTRMYLTVKENEILSEKKRLVAIYEAKAAVLDAKCLEVEAALDLLPSRFRRLLRARYIEGQKWQEIADAAPYSFERCMQLHRRALAMLRDRQQKST